MIKPTYLDGTEVGLGDLFLWERDETGTFEICIVINVFEGQNESPSDNIYVRSLYDRSEFSMRAYDIDFRVKQL